MPAISKPVMFLAVAGVIAAVVLAQQDDQPTAKPKTKSKTAKKKAQETDLLPADYKAHFEKATLKPRNLFMPLVVAKSANKEIEVDLGAALQDQDKISPDLAAGESGWVYTGYATIDGKAMALLENSTNHQGGFVKVGEPWKATRIVRITPQSIVMSDKSGADKVTLRYDPNKPKAGGDSLPGIKPVDPGPALNGPIGGPGGPPRPGGGPGQGGRGPGMSISNLPPGVTISDGPMIIRG